MFDLAGHVKWDGVDLWDLQDLPVPTHPLDLIQVEDSFFHYFHFLGLITVLLRLLSSLEFIFETYKEEAVRFYVLIKSIIPCTVLFLN